MNEVPPNEDAGASKTKKRLFWVDLTAFIVVALLVFVLFPASIFFLPIHRADAGYRKAKETINFEELRSWAQAEAKQHSGLKGESENVPRSEIPAYIMHLYSFPPEFVVADTGDTNCNARIVWGGGVFHWSFEIGSTNFVASTNLECPHVYELSPGIYYRRESSWGLL